MVRSRFTAVRVRGAAEPHDTAAVRLYYPAAPSGSDSERQTGELDADRSRAPLPVVVFLSGINIGSEAYRWLAVALVEAGYAVATFDHVGELMPGSHGLSPGLDLGALTPDAFGSRPCATAVGPLLDALEVMNSTEPLDGLLDLSRVALGGHSAGGTVALLNARPEWFNGVSAVFSYAGHTVPVDALGHPAGTVLPIGHVPALIAAGEIDGVMAASADRYGEEVGSSAHSPVRRTFDAGVGEDVPALEVVMAGANHLAVCHPVDPTSARGFLEPPPVVDPSATRAALAEVLLAFLDRHLRGDTRVNPAAVARGNSHVCSVRARP